MISAFAERFGLTQAQVFDLMAGRDCVGLLNEKWSNSTTQSNLDRYGKMLMKAMERMRRLADSRGFGVNFDHGIYPVLTKDGNEVYLPE